MPMCRSTSTVSSSPRRSQDLSLRQRLSRRRRRLGRDAPPRGHVRPHRPPPRSVVFERGRHRPRHRHDARRGRRGSPHDCRSQRHDDRRARADDGDPRQQEDTVATSGEHDRRPQHRDHRRAQGGLSDVASTGSSCSRRPCAAPAQTCSTRSSTATASCTR